MVEKMSRVELTSDRGWVPGTRPLKEGEHVLVILHVPGRTPVAVFTGGSGSFGLAYEVYLHIEASLEGVTRPMEQKTEAPSCGKYNSYAVEIGERGPNAGRCQLKRGHEGPHCSPHGRRWVDDREKDCE